MDNLSHTVLGALAGEAAARLIPAVKSVLPESTRRGLYLSLMVIGSNLPDADLLYSGLDGGKLGYLLHHRGHTHTVIGALLGAALLFYVALGWLRWRGLTSSREDRRWLALVAVLAPLLHLAMDATNNYGVHPFWPLYDGWLYGDTIFIIEPLFWIAAAPLVFLLHGRLARGAMAVVQLAGIGLAFGSGFVPWPLALCLTLLCALLLVVARQASARTAVLGGIAVWLGIIGMFALGHRAAATRTDTLVATHFPDMAVLDHVLTPMPVNPLCWELILAQADTERYVLRRAMLSLAPGWLEAAACPQRGLDVETTVPLTPVNAPADAAVSWYGETTMAREALPQLAHANCEAMAFMRYARMPWIVPGEGGWLVGDLRYDREPGLGFTELEIAGTPECPRAVPPWTPPRMDLLGEAASD